jgi:biopolymer transport protein ExbD
MAGVDVESGGSKKRATNSDINMIPFIDLLMVTIAFLLITAVWTTNSRLTANAQVPGAEGCGEECKQGGKTLHVHVNDSEFNVVWKNGATTLTEQRIPRKGTEGELAGGSFVRYPELAKVIEEEWKRSGDHKDPTDRQVDRAVIHTADQLPFKEIAAVLDAIAEPKRDMNMNGAITKIPAFATTFAVR